MFNKYFISLVVCLSSLCPTHTASMLKRSKSMPDLNLSDVATSLKKGVTSITTKTVIDALNSDDGKAAVLAIAKTLLGGAASAAGEMAKKAKEEAERMAAEMATKAKEEAERMTKRAKDQVKQVLDAFKKTLNQIPMGGSAIGKALEQAMTAAGLNEDK